MKIDLHCHTKKIKKGDPVTRNVTAELFAEKIQNADVEIVAITNHNTFDLEQYRLFKAKVHNFCNVWPGIEIDAYGDQKKKNKPVIFHLILVANPNMADQFKEAVDQLLDGFDVNHSSKYIADICEAVKGLDFLKDNKSQALFDKLVNIFIWDKNTDELYLKFANALELFEKSLEQEENYKDTTLSYMLLFSAAESLLTEGKNEKKLRLSIIWPRLVEITGISKKILV